MKNGLIPLIEQHTYIFQLGLQVLILITTYFRSTGKDKISEENGKKIYINRDEESSNNYFCTFAGEGYKLNIQHYWKNICLVMNHFPVEN